MSVTLLIAAVAAVVKVEAVTSHKTVTQARSGSRWAEAWPRVHFTVVRNTLAQGLVGVSLSANRGSIFAVGGYNGVQSVSGVQEIYPRQKAFTHLLVPTHDAASGWMGTDLYVFGGGQAVSYNTIVRVAPSPVSVIGYLPAALSDAVAIPYASGLLLIGGHHGNIFSKQALYYSHQGASLHAKALFRLTAGLRYAAIAQIGKQIWIAGGRTQTGMSREIYNWSPGLSEAVPVGRLPLALDKAAAWSIPGYVLIAGGQTLQGAPQKNIYAFNIRTRKIRIVGALPNPLSDMGYTSYGGTAYLAGGTMATNLSALSRDLLLVHTKR